MKRLWILGVVGVVLVGGVACSKTDPVGSDSAGTSTIQMDKETRQSLTSGPVGGAPAAEAPVRDDSAPVGTVGGSGVPGVPQRVIKSANLEVRIGKGAFQSKFDRASAIAEELGGFVTNSSTEQTKGRLASGTLTIRVPADRFQAALSKLKLLGKVTSESQSGQDVTREFVDLEARLRHAKAQEAFFLKLMDQSKTIADLVQVQQQLANVQLEIEQLQGQINYLKDQTSYSSITARIFEPVAAGSPEPKGLGKAMREAWAAFRTVIGGTVVFLGWATPLALIGLVGYGLWRATRRKEPVSTTS